MIIAPDKNLVKALFATETVSVLKHGDFIYCEVIMPNLMALTIKLLLIRARPMP